MAEPWAIMYIRYLLGRSGSGKTHACLAEIAREAQREPLGPVGGGAAGGAMGGTTGEASGGALILLTPEQSTFQMEQSLLSSHDLAGYHRVWVVGFGRLAQLAGAAVGAGTEAVLSAAAQRFCLRLLWTRQGGGETSEAVIEALQACRAAGVDAAVALERLRAEEERVAGGLKEKLEGIATLERAYEALLGGRMSDQAAGLERLAEVAGEVALFDGAQLWIDGFAGFSELQYRVLGALSRCVGRITVSLNLDPGTIDSLDALTNNDGAEVDPLDLFNSSRKTLMRLRSVFQETGVRVDGEEMVALPESDATLPRFAGGPALGQLERNLFHTAVDEGKFGQTGEIEGKAVVIAVAAQPRDEVVAAAREIRRLCRELGYKYRDVAIVLREFGVYDDLLEEVLGAYEIPFFLDRRYPLDHHPLVRLCQAALRCVALADADGEAVLGLLKTCLCGVTRGEVDELENFALAADVHLSEWLGERAWSREWLATRDGGKVFDYAALEQLRRRALGPVRRFLDGLGAEAAKTITVGDGLRAVCGLLEGYTVAGQLRAWSQAAEQTGQVEAAQQHRRVYEQLIGLLEELYEAVGREMVEVEAFAAMLSGALGGLSLGMAPPALDQVLIGTIQRSRNPQIKAAFVLGMNDGAFPARVRQDQWFSEAEQTMLAGVGLEMGPSVQQMVVDERYLAYIALTRAQERLWIGTSRADQEGKPLQESPYLEAVRAATAVQEVTLGPEIAEVGELEHVCEVRGALQAGLRGGCDLQAEPMRQWVALLAAGHGDALLGKTVEAYLSDLSEGEAAALLPSVGDDVLRASVSQLELFAACPYQHFGRYVLGLQEREQLALERVDVGEMAHRALQLLFVRLQEEGVSWAGVSNEQVVALVGDVWEGLVQQRRWLLRLVLRSARERLALDQARRQVEAFCQYLCAYERVGSFRQMDAEVVFGREGSGLEALVVEVGDGRSVRLHGKIDRVDVVQRADGTEGVRVGVRVIDYKTRKKAFSFSDFYHGLSLQLPVYLMAATASGREAVGMFYLGIQQERAAAAGHMQAEEIKERVKKAAGPLNGAWLEQLEGGIEGPALARFHQAYVKKDGNVYSSAYGSQSLEPGKFSAVLNYGQGTIRQLGKRILSGEYRVSPYLIGARNPCAWCSLARMCGFDKRCDSYRMLAGLNQKQVLEQVAPPKTDGEGV